MNKKGGGMAPELFKAELFKKATLSGVSTLALIIASMSGLQMAEAGGFALKEQSAYGQGSSFAGVAAGGSLSSMFWNPATMATTTPTTWTNERVLTFIAPTTEIDLLNPAFADMNDIALDAFVPSGYTAYRWNESLVLGLGTGAPFGLSTKVPLGHPVRAFSGTSEVFSFNANPTLSYQFNDWLSVGVGAQIQYLDVRLTNNSFLLQGDDIGFGFTAGLQLTPVEGTEIGLGFRSAVKQELEGDIGGTLALLNYGAAQGPIGVDLTTPEMVTLSIRQKVHEQWRVLGTVEWTNWSRIGTFPVINRNTGTAIDLNPLTVGVTEGLAFEYEDGWFFSGGVEYDYSDALTLRAGVGYDLSPINTDTRGYRLPDDDRLWLSTGLSYSPNNRLSFDLGYTYITAFDTDIVSPNISVPAAGFNATSESDVHIVSAALKVTTDEFPLVSLAKALRR
jgi:long-chain fatty acid transport protein